MRLSVICPFVNEDPMIRFTIQSLVLELQGKVDFEILAVNNYIPNPAVGQTFEEDGGHAALASLLEKGLAPYLRLVRYQDKLSHWNAKNFALRQARGDYIFFCDGHVMLTPGSLVKMLETYEMHEEEINGSLHLPISYLNDAPGKELVYLTVHNEKLGLMHYRFTGYHKTLCASNRMFLPFPVASMSTCGMLISRKIILEVMNGWPSMLGIYGGGENYMNFVQAVLGYTPHIMPGPPIYHYAAPRGYRWELFDWITNRLIAIFLAGGQEWAQRCTEAIIQTKTKGGPRQLNQILRNVINNEENQERRENIKKLAKYTLSEWAEMVQRERPHQMVLSEAWK